MRKVAIITTAFGNGLADRAKTYEKIFADHGLSPWYCTRDDLLNHPEGIEGVIVGVESADRVFMDTCKDMKVAMKFGVGLDNFDLAHAKEKGIEIANMPGINSDSVAEMAFSLMLCVSRRISTMDASCKRGEFEQICSNSIMGKTLGIAGVGTIGKKVARIAHAFNMRCIGYDVMPFAVDGIQAVGFDELLKEADIITIHIPLTPSSRHLFGASQFAVMKEGSIILNTARGGIVDEDALASAIEAGHIRGAGIDVFESEESVKRLCSLPSVVCTPHVAAYTHETLRHMEITAIEKMASILERIQS